ncbi:MAG: hypothetical protein ACYCYI_00175 [Saccharofermentanales bacterium]
MQDKIPKYRVLWTWDYCTFWDHNFFWRGKGCCGVNQRRAYFLEDYKRVVDYSADHGFNGIVIWGALRAHNNGEQQLKELATYASKKGVRILPGCGVFGYGGIYYDSRADYDGFWDIPMSENPYSLFSWLEKHPEYAAIDSNGNPYRKGPYSCVACPSRKENIEWFKEALSWLFTEFDIGGVQVEVGDYATCHCDLCNERRKGNEAGYFSIDDMLTPYAVAVETAKKIKPDAWVICETYSSFAEPAGPEAPGFGSALDIKQKDLLAELPDGAIVQWVEDRAVGINPAQIWSPDVYVPTQDNIARIHTGSQWNNMEEWGVFKIGDLVKKARMSGINGVSIFGEESPVNPPNEANYLVFSEFNGFGNPNPDCDFNLFYSQTLDPLYGGPGMAKEWEHLFTKGQGIRYGDLASFEKQRLIIQLANEVRDASSRLSGETCRRWVWLENWMWRTEYLHRTSISG